MKRYCISDMHLVDEGHRDSFARGNRLYRFRRFLDYVDANDGKLYILGDLLDIYQGALWKIVQTYSRLLTDLAEVTSMWVHGNHDGLFGGLLGTPLEELYVPRSRIFSRYSKPFCRTLGDVTILFCHGHECDPYCKDGNPGLGELTATITGMMEDYCGGAILPTGGYVEDVFLKTLSYSAEMLHRLNGSQVRSSSIYTGIDAERILHKAERVVFGHTHEPGTRETTGGLLINTGCWCRDCDTFVEITDSGTTSLWQWTEDCQASLFERTLA